MVTENFLNTALWSVGFISVISHAITCLTSTFENYGYMVMALTKLYLISYFLAIITLRGNPGETSRLSSISQLRI